MNIRYCILIIIINTAHHNLSTPARPALDNDVKK